MLNLLMKTYKVFSTSYKTFGCMEEIVPDFKLLHNYALQTKLYPIPKIAKQFAQKEIPELLKAGIIENFTSNYCFPAIFVKKKLLPDEATNDSKFRMVIHYKLLNSITESYKICFPKITDILQNISEKKKIYSVLDLKTAFFQIKLQDKHKQILAFATEFGNFQPCWLPFGLN